VIVGSKGLTASVLNEVEVALKTHELIKVKLACDDREERASQCAALSEALAAAPVQQVGKIVVLYRRRTEITEPPPQQPGKHFAAHSPRRAPRPRPVRKSAG
jgi:RNA-binding protein